MTRKHQFNKDVMQRVEQIMLMAAIVSWVVTHVMDKLLVLWMSVQNLTWEKTMNHLNTVMKLAQRLVVKAVCSSAIVTGTLLEWLACVTRAVGIVVSPMYYKHASPWGFGLYDQSLRHYLLDEPRGTVPCTTMMKFNHL